MADKVPVKATFDANGDADGLAEFQASETVGYNHGGTGLSSLGTAGQFLRVNSGATGLEYGTITADIEGVVAGDGLSGGGDSGTPTINLDLNELTAAVVDVANDFISIIDADDSNASRKDSIADLIAAIAGVGLGVASGVLKLDLNELTGATVNVANDSIAIIDADDSNNTKKESIADFVSAIAGSGLTATNGQLTAGAGFELNSAKSFFALNG